MQSRFAPIVITFAHIRLPPNITSSSSPQATRSVLFSRELCSDSLRHIPLHFAVISGGTSSISIESASHVM